MQITNTTGVSLAMAVWLVHDDYDYNKQENYISATALMKPLRHIVLPGRIPSENRVVDVSEFASRALGNSIHDSVEKAWVKGYKTNLRKLGYPDKVIERILVNPTDEELNAVPDCIPVYVEQRAFKKVTVLGKTWTVGGKFDMVTEGIVQDTKSTSTYKWVKGGGDDEYSRQGSLYRWLNPDKITEPFIRINFIFTDWQKYQAKQNPAYPQQRVEHRDILLTSVSETQSWVEAKLKLVMQSWNLPENQLPLCTDEELWMSDPKFKYYADPAKTSGRSTKNFESHSEARDHMASKGGKGIIITDRGEPKRCDWCDAFEACTQKNSFPKYQQA